jgi:hypothetical protein
MEPDTGTLYNARRWQDGSFMVGINSCAKLSWAIRGRKINLFGFFHLL